jgi:PGF-pre-PGF domain-containing protein
LKKLLYLISILLFAASLIAINAFSRQNAPFVSQEVTANAAAGQDVGVIIKLREPGKTLSGSSSQAQLQDNKEAVKKNLEFFLSYTDQTSGFRVRRKYTLTSSIAATISSDELERLKNDPNIESITYDLPVHGFLNNSLSLINASSFSGLLINNLSVNGTGETVCVLDTGVDYTHPALGGCYGNNDIASACKVWGGYDFVNSDDDPTDDFGHGTHVAGIIASINSTFRGVAPGARIIALKVLDSQNSGYSSDVDAGIEWCINNATRFNISVISMSLGGGRFYDYCDSDEPTTSGLIGEAVRNNIFVSISSGNDGYSDSMGSPACLFNATSVGSVYDANVGGPWVWGSPEICTDAGTQADNISCFSDSASFLDLIAPGAMITSTKMSGGFLTEGGTSMAAPHVSGAALLLRNFKRSENGTILTVGQIKSILKTTGKNITDTRNGHNFARINMSSALSFIDDTPRIAFTSVITNNSNISVNSTFINITSSEPLSNATIEIDGQNMSLTGSSRNFYSNITNLADGSHNFTVLFKDTTHTQFFGSAKYAFSIDTKKPNLTDVAYEISLSGATVYFNTSEKALSKIQYGLLPGIYIYEMNGSAYYTQSHNITLSNLQSYSTYYYIVNFTDPSGNRNESTIYTLTASLIDIYYPGWSGNTTYPQTGQIYDRDAVYQFNVSWIDDTNLSRVWIEHDFSGTLSNYTATGNSSNVYYYNYNAMGAGTYTWRFFANDSSGKINSTNIFQYSVLRKAAAINLTLNGTETDMIVNQSSMLNITANTTGDSIVMLFINGTLINNRTRCSNLTVFDGSGLYNITATYPESQNYSTATKTLWVNVLDSLPPRILILSPRNSSLNVRESVLNISLDEDAVCAFRIDEGALNTTESAQNFRYKPMVLDTGSYNLTVTCTDSAGHTGNATAFNFSVDGIAPELSIRHPAVYQTYDSFTVDINYTLNESHLDKVWYYTNHGTDKTFIPFVDSTGSENIHPVTFNYPGKEEISLYANDTAGNMDYSNITFFINRTFNVTPWSQDLESYLEQAITVQVMDSAGNNLSGNITLNQSISLELNFSDISVAIYNLTSGSMAWSRFFGAMDDLPEFESQILSNYGNIPVNYIVFSNFSIFDNNSDDYYAKVKLPYNISAYTGIYYCPGSGQSDCELLSACPGTSFSETSTAACFVASNPRLIVFLPHFSSVFAVNDSSPPVINITSPQNITNLTSSYMNDLVFKTDEDATCAFSLNSTGTYTNLGGSARKSFSTNFSSASNRYHNLTVNCTDIYGNSGLSRIFFGIADSTRPSISLTLSSTTTSIFFDISTNEPANFTVSVSGQTSSASQAYARSYLVNFTGLSTGTTYSFNVTACDSLGNCRTTSSTKRTNLVTSSNEGETSSTGTVSGNSTSAVVKVSQLWQSPEAGDYTLNIPANAIAVTQIDLTLKNDVDGDILFTIEKVSSVPSTMPSVANVYQYLKVEKTLISDADLSDVVFKFRVEKTWMSSNNIDPATIALIRYSGAWAKLPTRQKSSDSNYYYYEADSPGMSYFAISGEKAAAVELPLPPPADDGAQVPAPTGNAVDEGAKEAPEAASPADIKPKGDAKSAVPIILGIVLLAVIVSGALLFMMTKQQAVAVNDKSSLESKIEEKQASSLDSLMTYVKKCKAEGIQFQDIKNNLLRVGWQETMIDEAMDKIDIPRTESDSIKSYIIEMRKYDKTDEEIKARLKAAGWQEEIINGFFHRP